MTLTKQGPFTKKVTDLPNTPSPSYTPSDIKSYFQTPADELASSHNALVDQLESKIGAGSLGAIDEDGSTTSNIQAQLEKRTNNLNTHKTAVVLDHPDQSVTTSKLKDKNVTSVKIGDGEVKTVNIDSLSVTNEKLASGITGDKISTKQIGREHVKSGAIGLTELDPAIISQPGDGIAEQAKFASIDAQLAETATNIFNVKAKYKADSSGVLDSSPQIQSALDAAKLSGGGIVFVPDGIYLIKSPLKIYSNTKLILAPSAVMKRGANIDNMIRNGTEGMGLYSGDNDIEISGGVWDGNLAQYPSNTTAIAFGHAKNISIYGTTIKNVFGWHHIEFNAVDNGKIRDCNLLDFDATTTGKEMIQLDLMVSAGAFPWFGPYDNTPCNNILIEGCTFNNAPRAIGTHSATVGFKHTNIKIIANHIVNMREEAIIGFNWEKVTISHNTIENADVGIGFSPPVENCTDLIIDNNQLYNLNKSVNSSRGIYVGGGTYYYENVIISNNKLRLIGRHGIGADYANYLSIQGNVVTGCGHTGIWLFQNKHSSANNNISNGNNTSATAGRADIVVGSSSPQSLELMAVGNKCGTMIINPTSKGIITNNLVSTTLTNSADTSVKVTNNMIAGTWTV